MTDHDTMTPEPLLPAANCSCEICSSIREAAQAAALLEAALSLTAQGDATTANVNAATPITATKDQPE